MDAVVPDMDRFFASASAWQEGMVSLDQDESHHCLRVMRKQLGDEIEVFDGEGCWARGVIAESEDGVVRVEVRDEGRAEERPPLITLAVAIPKGKTMELIVQKAVELGASAIQPLMTEHTVVRVDGKEALKKREKWQRVAVEACNGILSAEEIEGIPEQFRDRLTAADADEDGTISKDELLKYYTERAAQRGSGGGGGGRPGGGEGGRPDGDTTEDQ